MLQDFAILVKKKRFTVRRIRSEMKKRGWNLANYSDCRLVKGMLKVLRNESLEGL